MALHGDYLTALTPPADGGWIGSSPWVGLLAPSAAGTPAVAADTDPANADAADAWSLNNRVEATLDRLNLDPAALMGTLSGGMQKRVALACVLAQAQHLATEAMTAITWDGEFHRHDIGWRAIARERDLAGDGAGPV